jgi:putative SOS response-associated peptidase YedK
MCGRYAASRRPEDLIEEFEIEAVAEQAPGEDLIEEFEPEYNVAPTKTAPVVFAAQVDQNADRPARRLRLFTWGLVPWWAEDRGIAGRLINARAETILDKPAYRTAVLAQRCLIPADGWFEFAPRPDAPRGKQAFYMTSRDGSPMVFGGLWSVWGEGDAKLLTCSIVTREAIGALRDVHDRMPLILDPARWAAWLTGPADPDALLAAPSDAFVDAVEIRPVGPAVGDVRNDGPHLIEALPATAPIDLTLF